jgi:hypothetical protein
MNQVLAVDFVARSLAASVARFLAELEAVGPALLRLETAGYPSAGLLRSDADEARFRCEDIADSLAAMARGEELCPHEADEALGEPAESRLDRLERLVGLVGRGVEAIAAA